MNDWKRYYIFIACILVVGLILFLYPKTPSKRNVESYLLPIKYDAKITEIKTDHQVYVKGIDKLGNDVSYSIYSVWYIAPYVAIGDSLKKDSGDLSIRIVKKDTVINIDALL